MAVPDDPLNLLAPHLSSVKSIQPRADVLHVLVDVVVTVVDMRGVIRVTVTREMKGAVEAAVGGIVLEGVVTQIP